MKDIIRFLIVFVLAIIGSAYVHELGHGIAGWVQGIAVLPTPCKEYVLRDQIEWDQEIWIALGGVAATMLLSTGTLVWYATKDRLYGDPVLAAVLLTPFAYTVRFLVVGRGHDGLEWQAAQSAIGASPTGHAVDIIFLVLFLVGSSMWVIHRRTSLRPSSLIKITGLVVIGIAVIVTLQVANNFVFDRYFPRTHTVNVPPMLQATHK